MYFILKQTLQSKQNSMWNCLCHDFTQKTPSANVYIDMIHVSKYVKYKGVRKYVGVLNNGNNHFCIHMQNISDEVT